MPNIPYNVFGYYTKISARAAKFHSSSTAIKTLTFRNIFHARWILYILGEQYVVYCGGDTNFNDLKDCISQHHQNIAIYALYSSNEQVPHRLYCVLQRNGQMKPELERYYHAKA